MNPNTSKENVDHEEDRLSNLPDDVLIGILSHLETKELVRSGILSKRWKSVWFCIPTLVLAQYDFSLRDKEYDADDVKARFSNFVYEMLIARKLPSLEKISICSREVDPHLVELWMQAALERDESKLEVEFFDNQITADDREMHLPCELTHNLFSYNKLVVMKLGGYMAPNFPKTSSCFPSLKELELKDIYYRDCDSLPNLLSSCPILEYMTIIREGEYWARGEWDRILGNTGTLIITSRSLKRLTVRCEIDSLFKGDDEFKMVFDAPALEFVDISCIVANEYVVNNLSNLVKAELNFLDVSAVLEIPKDSPQLEILNIRKAQNERELSELDVPSCLITQLKTIHIDFEWHDNIEKVRYFLINAKALERMTISVLDIDESLKLKLCNVILESAADSVTWPDREDRDSEVVLSFSKPRI